MKNIITSKRVVVIIVCIFVVLISSVAPVYVVNKLEMIFFEAKNKTMLGLVHTSDRERVEVPTYAINNVFIPFSAFIIVIICTVTLVIKLRQKTKWRKTSTNSQQADNTSNRDMKVAKMVVSISGLFIICFIPVAINFIPMCLEKEFSINGRYRNINFITMGIGLLLESVNSTLNIFIYYHMSSRYKAVFHKLFRI